MIKVSYSGNVFKITATITQIHHSRDKRDFIFQSLQLIRTDRCDARNNSNSGNSDFLSLIDPTRLTQLKCKITSVVAVFIIADASCCGFKTNRPLVVQTFFKPLIIASETCLVCLLRFFQTCLV